jgi:osmotically-inducible protein OsmY
MKIIPHCAAPCLLAALSVGNAAQEPATAPERAPQVAIAPMDPQVAAGQVSRALHSTPGIPAADVVVSTHADTVVLTGEVGSEIEAARAVSVAQGAAGGLRVSSQISIRPDEQQAAIEQATQLARSVEQALRDNPRTANLGVAVSVDEAQVIGLHGLVPTRESRTLAEDLASRIAGAKRIRSHLLVPGG